MSEFHHIQPPRLMKVRLLHHQEHPKHVKTVHARRAMRPALVTAADATLCAAVSTPADHQQTSIRTHHTHARCAVFPLLGCSHTTAKYAGSCPAHACPVPEVSQYGHPKLALRFARAPDLDVRRGIGEGAVRSRRGLPVVPA